jgi:hypothetical protein
MTQRVRPDGSIVSDDAGRVVDPNDPQRGATSFNPIPEDPNDQYSKHAAAIAKSNEVVVDGDKGGFNAYHSPGAADVGGGPDMAAWYKQDAQGRMGDNDAQQASNEGGLLGSLANMKGNRGPQSVEDVALANRAAAARGEQLGALNLDRVAAQGGAPSAAAFQTTQGMNDIMASRAGALGGAHNLAGLTGAQMGTMGGAGGMASGLAMQGGMGRSKEIADAIGMYGSNAGAVRQQDIARLGLSDQNSKFNAQNDIAWKLGNANLAAQQGGLGVAQNATDNGWFDQSMKPEATQFSYDQEMAALANGADADAAGASIARAREANDHARGVVQGVTSGVLTAAGTVAGGPVGGAAGAAAGAGVNAATSDWWK